MNPFIYTDFMPLAHISVGQLQKYFIYICMPEKVRITLAVEV